MAFQKSMDCDICGKEFGARTLPNCITCARNALEPYRLEMAKTLIEQEAVGKHIESVVQGKKDASGQQISLKDSTGGILVDPHECTKNLDLQRTRAETAEVEERISLITEQAARLREEMEKTRQQIAAKNASLAQRRSDFDSATYGIKSRRANELEKVQQDIKRREYKWDKMHHETLETRMYLCNAAARLAGLKMTRRRTKDGGVKEVYNIGPASSLRIYDLRDLNNADFDRLSASLASVTQLLVRVSHYLGVRLPAEITLPHRDYPQPTIFNTQSSYRSLDVPFPGSTPSNSSSNSPDVSRTFTSEKDKKGKKGKKDPELPKPRILSIDRKLPDLAAQDPPAYAMFLEGISHLAYDIAWLCRTQGLLEDFNHWEDVCPMGRNLYRLLIQQETRPPLKPENPLDKEIVAAGKPNSTSKSQPSRPLPGFGELSHATAHSFLGAAENITLLRSWKLTPTTITDGLKALLLAEQQGQEWEILNQKEWDDMENIIAEEPVLIGTKRRDTGALDDGRSVLSIASAATTTTTVTAALDGLKVTSEKAGTPEKLKNRGVNGWTKVKSRAAEESSK